MRIRQAASVSHPGALRSHNEDVVLPVPELPLYAVADGMGGQGAGERAAAIAMEVVGRYTDQLRRANKSIFDDRSTTHRLALSNLLDELFNQAGREIHREKDRLGRPGMASTLLVATVVRNFAYVGHVGDSRAYLLREGRLVGLTEDHSVGEFRYRRGKISLEEYQSSDERRILYQALGAGVEVEVDLAEVRLGDGDVLLLCSDGLIRSLSEERVAELIDASNVTASAHALVDAANDAGADDNVSVVLLAMAAESADEPIEAITEVMREIFLFKDLSRPELLLIAPYLEEVVLPKDAVVCCQGDPADMFYGIASGGVRITHGSTPLTEVRKGGHFGELALARPVTRSATIRTIARTRMFALSRERFQELLRAKPELGAKLSIRLLDAVGNRLRDLSERLAAVQRAARGEIK